MTQTKILTVNITNSQFNKLKSTTKKATEVTLKFKSNILGNSYDEIDFPHKLLLTDRQVSKLCKYFANNSSGNIKLSKTQLSKVVQSRGFLDKILGSLLNTGRIARSVLIPLELKAAASATEQLFKRKVMALEPQH